MIAAEGRGRSGRRETYKIAEDEGTSELKSMIHGGFLGIMTSILLYGGVALSLPVH